MSSDWYFGVGDDGKTIEAWVRAESADGLTIGDVWATVGGPAKTSTESPMPSCWRPTTACSKFMTSGMKS
jgi:hypothetical protein